MELQLYMKLFRFGTHERNVIFLEGGGDEEYNDDSRQLLIDMKCRIDRYDIQMWERSKKSNNDYEYIYTSSRNNKNICNITPVSRSYFKLYEMIKDFNLLKKGILCASLAEGPGGFMHCLNDFSDKGEYSLTKCYGITLISDDRRVPYWNQIITKHPINEVISGVNKDGDLYNIDNVMFFINKVGENTCHLITADGGFDYSDDYNSQENSSYRLLYSEVFIALHNQKEGGHFVLKVFDLFSYKTIQLLYLLYCHYEKVELYKPSTSRLSNSEKYTICSGFMGCKSEVKNQLHKIFTSCEDMVLDIPVGFIKEIQDYNKAFTELQVNKIKEILQSIHKPNNNYPSKEQITNAKRWCELYGLPINNRCIYLQKE